MKLGQGKMKPIELAHDPNRHDKHGETNYECMSCGEKWKLNDPDNAFRGYFLKRSTVIKVPNRLTTAQTIGLVLLGVLVIRVIYGLLMN